LAFEAKRLNMARKVFTRADPSLLSKDAVHSCWQQKVVFGSSPGFREAVNQVVRI